MVKVQNARYQAGRFVTCASQPLVYYRSDGQYVVRDNINGQVYEVSNMNREVWYDPFGELVRPRE